MYCFEGVPFMLLLVHLDPGIDQPGSINLDLNYFLINRVTNSTRNSNCPISSKSAQNQPKSQILYDKNKLTEWLIFSDFGPLNARSALAFGLQ